MAAAWATIFFNLLKEAAFFLEKNFLTKQNCGLMEKWWFNVQMFWCINQSVSQ